MKSILSALVAIAGVLTMATWLFPMVILPLFAVVGVWYVLGLQVVKENERGLKVFLGHPYQTVESGLRWVPFLFGKMLHYGTGIVELNFDKPAGILTKKGSVAGEERVFGPANIGANISFRFRWPVDLIQAVKFLPPPHDRLALTSIFEEVVLDDVRNEGGKRVWIELARDRKGFAQVINASLLEVPTDSVGQPTQGNVIVDSQIQQPTVAIDHLEIPPALLTSLTAEEIAQLEKTATIIRAEGEKRKRQLEGEGLADAKSKLLEAIRAQPENLRIQSLLTLEQMAQGAATTIFPIPTDIMNTLSDVFGKERGLGPEQLMKILTPEQRNRVGTFISEILRPQDQGPLNQRRRS